MRGLPSSDKKQLILNKQIDMKTCIYDSIELLQFTPIEERHGLSVCTYFEKNLGGPSSFTPPWIHNPSQIPGETEYNFFFNNISIYYQWFTVEIIIET